MPNSDILARRRLGHAMDGQALGAARAACWKRGVGEKPFEGFASTGPAQESLPRETNNLPQPKTGALGPGLTQTAPPTSTSRYFSRYLTQTRRISFQKQAVWCVVPIAMAANRRRGRAERQRRRSEEVPVMRLALLGRAVSMD